MSAPLEALKKAQDAGWNLEFFANEQPKCPHCGASHDISQSGTYRLYEEGEHELTCGDCDRDFKVQTRVSYSFSTDEQDEA